MDFPDPLTPLMQTSRFSGSFTSIFWRLCSAAPSTRSHCEGERSVSDAGTDTARLPDRYCAVNDFVERMKALRDP